MSDYIDKIKKGESEFDIHDIRVDSLTSGTKLYKHTITCTAGSFCEVCFIDTVSTPYTSISEITNIRNIVSKVYFSYGTSYPQTSGFVLSYDTYSVNPQATPGNNPILLFNGLRRSSSNFQFVTLQFTVDKTTGAVSAGTEQTYNMGSISSDTVTPL